jgi:ATP diphosphatase
MDLDEAAKAFREFVTVVRALRTPGSGCPWDLEQTHQTLRPYLTEETGEVLDAIDRGDDPALREELGDLLLQVVLHAQLSDDRGAFSITEVARGIAEKMVRRHPHVFGPARVSGAAEVRKNWEQIKADEARGRGDDGRASKLSRIPAGLPALARAQRVVAKSSDGLADRRSPAELADGVRAALEALEREIRAAPAAEAVRPAAEEARARRENALGEVLFLLCGLAHRLGVNAEDSLRAHTTRTLELLRGLGRQSEQGTNGPAAPE